MCVCAYAYTYTVCACVRVSVQPGLATNTRTGTPTMYFHFCMYVIPVCTYARCMYVWMYVEVRGQANHMCAADMIAWRTLSVSKAKTHVDIHADFCACLADVYASLCMHPSGPVHECIQSMHARAHAQLHVHVVGRFMYITTHVCIHAHRYAHGSYLVTFCM